MASILKIPAETETQKIVSHIWAMAREYDKIGVMNGIRMFRDDWRDMVVKELKDTFTAEAFKRLKPLVTTEVNLQKKVTEETAMVYKEPARRSCKVGEENSQEVARYSEIVTESKINIVMKLVNKYTRLCNHVLIQVVAREGKINYDIYTPDAFDIYTDPGDWKDIVAIAVESGQRYPSPGQEVSKIRTLRKIWTRKPVRIGDLYLEAGKIYTYQAKTLLKVEDNPYQVFKTQIVGGKEIKVIDFLLPFVLTYKNFPIDSLQNYTDGSSLFTANVEIAVMLVLLNEIIKYQSFNQPYMIIPDQVKTPETMISGPWAIMQLKVPQGFQADVGTLQLQTNPMQIWQVIQERIFFVLAQNGVPPSSYQISRSPQSGISMKIERRALEEIRQNDIEYYRDFENQLFDITRVVNNVHSKNQIPDEAKFSVDFAEPKYDYTIQEVIQEETHELANNLTNPAKLLMKRNPDLSLLNADREVEENRRANTPVAPVPGIVGEAFRPHVPATQEKQPPEAVPKAQDSATGA